VHTEGIVQILPRACAVAIDGECKASDTKSRHVLLLLTHSALTLPRARHTRQGAGNERPQGR
jgi:hypothetical protein